MQHILRISLLLFFISCNFPQQNNNSNNKDKIKSANYFKKGDNVYSNFRFLNDSMQETLDKWDMDIYIKNSNDTLLFDYIVMSQYFINTNGDSTQFSGYFFEKDIIENKVTFPIVNSYKKGFDPELYFYRLELEFSLNFDTVYWKLLDKVNYLPTKDTLVIIDDLYQE